MKKVIKVEAKSVYGKTLIYPVCNFARLLCDIANTKTFTDHMLRRLKQGGYLFVDERISII